MTESRAAAAAIESDDQTQVQPVPGAQLFRELGLGRKSLITPPVVRIDNYRLQMVLKTDRPNSPRFIAAQAALMAMGCMVKRDDVEMTDSKKFTVDAPLTLLPEEEVNLLAKQTGEALTTGIMSESARLRKPARYPEGGC